MIRDDVNINTPEVASTTDRAKVGWSLRIFAAVLAAVSIILSGGGVYLLWLGGSPYYLVAGLTCLACSYLLWKGRRTGARLYAAMLAGTVVWAVWESGIDPWALAPRMIAPFVLGGWLLHPAARRGYGAQPLRRVWLVPLVVGLAAFATMFVLFPGEPRAGDPTRLGPASPTDWVAWGGDQGGMRHATANQLTPANVSGLRVAWTFETGAKPRPGGVQNLGFGVTPLKVGNSLFLCSPFNVVSALDPVTGREKWRFDPRVDQSATSYAQCRGIAYRKLGLSSANAVCAERLYLGTIDARLISIDAKTGRPCTSFGNGGEVRLSDGLGPHERQYYFHTSAPTVAGNAVVVGSFVLDGQTVNEPSGVVRAYDLESGALLWAFDPANPERNGPLPAGQNYVAGTPNSWSISSADEKLGLIYVPFGAPTPDYYGGQRTPEIERFANSIVALDLKTGKPRWSFQVVHHDLWDYDVAAQPVLTDLNVNGRRVPALVSVSKTGAVFILDRATGKPLSRVEERPVPQGAAPGDRTSPTQPFSVDLPSLAGGTLSETSMWGLTPLDQLWCRIAYRQRRYEGMYTPPSLGGSLQFPGFGGGVNWGSVSIDPERGVMIANDSRIAINSRLISPIEAQRMGIKPGGNGVVVSSEAIRLGVPQKGARYAMLNGVFSSPLGVPCNQPPFGKISAIDLRSKKLLWSVPIGLADRMGPLGLPSGIPFTIGLPTLGGSITTSTGLTFIGSTPDRRIRAYNTMTGKLLWWADLPANANATPMTYVAADGRQYVVIAAGGSAALSSNSGNVLVAFALPKLR